MKALYNANNFKEISYMRKVNQILIYFVLSQKYIFHFY